MKQYLIIVLLAGLLIGVVAGRLYKPVGRYQVDTAIGDNGLLGMVIINTATGQTWARMVSGPVVDLGTPSNPKGEKVELEK